MAHVSNWTAPFVQWLTDVLVKSGEEGMLHILNRSLRKEGARFFFKGWTPAFVRLGPNTVLLFVFLEVCLALIVLLVSKLNFLQQLKKTWRTSHSS